MFRYFLNKQLIYFNSKAQLMLDLDGSDMDGILDSMLKHLLEEEVSVSAYIEAKKALFTRDAGEMVQLLNSMNLVCE